MDPDILEGIITVIDEPVEQSAADWLAAITTAATNPGIAMAPHHVAHGLRKIMQERDANVIENLVVTLPIRMAESGIRAIPVVSIQAEAKRRRKLS